MFVDYDKTVAQGIDILGDNWEVQRSKIQIYFTFFGGCLPKEYTLKEYTLKNKKKQRLYHKEGIILGRLGKGNETSKGFALVRVCIT